MTKPKTYAVMYPQTFYPVKIIFAPNEKAWASSVANMDPDEPNPPYPKTPGRMSSFTCNGELFIFITIGDEAANRDALTVIGLMVHECMHVVQQVESYVGSKFDPETEAYFMQDLCMWLFGAFVDAGRTFKKDLV